MEKNQLYRLIKNILSRTDSTADQDAVDQHLYDAFHTEEWDEQQLGSRAEVENRMLKNVQRYSRSAKTIRPLTERYKPLYAYAAAILIFLFIGLGIYYMGEVRDSTSQQGKEVMACQDSILKPGEDIASLALSNGTVLQLDELDIGETKTVGDFIIKKNAQGSLEYVFGKSGTQDEKAMNTLQTPLGGTHKIILEDGTRIWLNAGSTLTFPTVFAQAKRVVQVTGEAYFEVQHESARPFVVNVNGLAVNVLGTTFNVSAYKEDAGPTVALLSGAVSLRKDNTEAKLTPGRKAKLVADQFHITAFDPEVEVAWKDDYFLFKDQNIKTIMNELARWYKADVLYEGEGWADKNFTVRISRKQDIAEILALIELTKSVNFKIKGRRIIVST